jgi:hypothetical protein
VTSAFYIWLSSKKDSANLSDPVVVGLQLLVGDPLGVRHQLEVGGGEGVEVDAEDVRQRLRPQRVVRRRQQEEGLGGLGKRITRLISR